MPVRPPTWPATSRLRNASFTSTWAAISAPLPAFSLSVVGSIVYLITRNLDWDRLAQAAIEVGLVFGLGTVVTGMFWAKPTWNTYWTWDPRLTTSTITVLVYIAYLLFRNGIDNRQYAGALWQHLCHSGLSECTAHLF